MKHDYIGIILSSKTIRDDGFCFNQHIFEKVLTDVYRF